MNVNDSAVHGHLASQIPFSPLQRALLPLNIIIPFLLAGFIGLAGPEIYRDYRLADTFVPAPAFSVERRPCEHVLGIHQCILKYSWTERSVPQHRTQTFVTLGWPTEFSGIVVRSQLEPGVITDQLPLTNFTNRIVTVAVSAALFIVSVWWLLKTLFGRAAAPAATVPTPRPTVANAARPSRQSTRLAKIAARPADTGGRNSNATESTEFRGATRLPNGVLKLGKAGALPKTAASVIISEYLIAALTEDGGVRAENILAAIGALAGFAAQQTIRETFIKEHGQTEQSLFTIIETKDGATYYFGDTLNMIVASTTAGQLSIWRVVAGTAVEAGLKPLPSLEAMFARVSKNLGTEEFGMPDVPKHHRPTLHPRIALDQFWVEIHGLLLSNGIEPLHWALELAVTAQNLMRQTAQGVPPAVALQIVMEAAIAMSKVSPASVRMK
jgi:hypothetical protein